MFMTYAPITLPVEPERVTIGWELPNASGHLHASPWIISRIIKVLMEEVHKDKKIRHFDRRQYNTMTLSFPPPLGYSLVTSR
jgi:hypothetical protein